MSGADVVLQDNEPGNRHSYPSRPEAGRDPLTRTPKGSKECPGFRIRGNEARPDSDIDLLIDLEPDRSLLDVGGLAMDLSLLLDRPVDVVTEAGLRERIRSRVLREARPL